MSTETTEKDFNEQISLQVKEFNEGQAALKLKLKELEDAQSKAVGSVALKSLEDSLTLLVKSQEDKNAKLQEILISQGQAIAAMSAKGDNAPSFKSLEDALTFAVMSKKSEIDAIVANGGKQTETLEIKAVVDISTLNTIGAGSTQYSLTQNTGIISPIRKRELTYRANVSVGGISTKYALWIEETTEDGTPIMLAEGATKTQLSVRYVEKTQPVGKCAVYGKVTTEMLADLPQLISYIQNNLMKRLDIKIEDELFTGTGVGDELKGADAFATAFTGGSMTGANGVTAPNELDVIEAIALQTKEALGQPTALFIHPSTLSKIKLIKDDAKRPIWKEYVTTNGELVISGMKIIESMAMTAGNFIGGDTTVLNVLIREELGIQIGLDGNDFINNKKTMLAEKRLVQFVSANDTACLIKGDFTTAKAAITVV